MTNNFEIWAKNAETKCMTPKIEILDTNGNFGKKSAKSWLKIELFTKPLKIALFYNYRGKQF